MDKLRGRAWCFGDNVETDLILPGAYMRLPPHEAAKHVMAGIDPGFAAAVGPGDLIVAGRSFGAGSSRELAAHGLQLAGVGGVVAQSFGRIFFRNAVNLGFPVLECAETTEIRAGDELEVELPTGEIRNLTRGTVHRARPPAGLMLEMVQAGGLVPYLEEAIRSGRLRPAPPPPPLPARHED